MTLRAFNTLTRRKEDLAPGRGGEMRIYVCGVTVWDASHIGHGRSAIVFDVIRRYLRHRGYEVKFVRNFTDVDDKIIRRANEDGVTAQDARRALHRRVPGRHGGARRPARRRRAQGHRAHPADDRADRAAHRQGRRPTRSTGDVYFAVRRFPGYGKLSGTNLDELRAGARVEVGRAQARPARLRALEGGQAGRAVRGRARGARAGRAGTSSARRWRMQLPRRARFDIHGGGKDLIFPHHENEIAQSRGRAPGESRSRATGCTTASSTSTSEKMSKSLGNFVTIRDVLAAQRRRGAARSSCSAPTTATPSTSATTGSPRPARPRAAAGAQRGGGAHRRARNARPDPTAGCRPGGRAAGAVRRRDGRRLQHAPGARGALRSGARAPHRPRAGGAGRGGRGRLPHGGRRAGHAEPGPGAARGPQPPGDRHRSAAQGRGSSRSSTCGRRRAGSGTSPRPTGSARS